MALGFEISTQPRMDCLGDCPTISCESIGILDITPEISEVIETPVTQLYTVEPLNNGQVGDERFVHYSEVVPSSEVEMYGQYGQYTGRG